VRAPGQASGSGRPPEAPAQETPGGWPAEILMECGTEGHPLETKAYKGSPPTPFPWPEACEKFGRYTASMLGAPRATAIIDAVKALERASNMADVARLVAST